MKDYLLNNYEIKDEYFQEMERNTAIFEEKLRNLNAKTKAFNESQQLGTEFHDQNFEYETNSDANNFQYDYNNNIYSSGNHNNDANKTPKKFLTQNESPKKFKNDDEFLKKINQLMSEIEYKDNIIDDLQKKIAILREKNISLEEQNLKLVQNQIPQENLDQMNFEMGRLSKELENKEKIINEMIFNEKTLNNKIENLILQNQNLTNKQEKLNDENEQLQSSNEKLKDEISMNHQKILTLEKINKISTRDYETLNHEFMSLKEDKQKFENLYYGQKEKIFNYQKEINSLQQIVDDTLNKKCRYKDNGIIINNEEYNTENTLPTKYKKVNFNKKSKNDSNNTNISISSIPSSCYNENNLYQNPNRSQIINSNYLPQRNHKNPICAINFKSKNINNRCNTINDGSENGGQDDECLSKSSCNVSKKRKSNSSINPSEKNYKNNFNYRYEGYDGFNYFTCDKKLKLNKNEIEELNMKLNFLMNEKMKLENEIMKLPEQSRTISDLKKKKELNNSIKETENRINEIKIRLKKLTRG